MENISLPQSDIHLWICYTDRIPKAAESSVFPQLINHAEKQALKECVRAEVARQKLFTRGLIRKILSYYAPIEPTGWEFAKTEHGKPYIANRQLPHPLFFNISHSQDAILIGVSQHPAIGVDIENNQRRINPLKLAGRFFHPAEIETLSALDASQLNQTFFTYWTLKEACIKAMGLGLRHPVKNIQIISKSDLGTFDICLHNSPSSNHPWTFCSFEPQKHLNAAVAIQTDTEKPLNVTIREIRVTSQDIDYTSANHPFIIGTNSTG